MNPSDETFEPNKPGQPPTKFFIVYGDFETGVRARHFAEELDAGLGAEKDSALTLWRCEMLELAELADHAAREAEGSDFLILSLPGDAGLSPTIKHWIERWLGQAAGSGACLVTIFDPARGVRNHVDAIRCYLRQITAGAGVDFFAHCVTAPNGPASSSLPAAGRINNLHPGGGSAHAGQMAPVPTELAA